MEKAELKERFCQFSLRIIRMVDAMPHTVSAWAIAKQVVRSGTSPAANYRAACYAKSLKDFVNKLKMVEEELDETQYWIQLMMEVEMLPKARLEPLYMECGELLNIISRSIITSRKKLNERKGNRKL